MSGVPCCIGAPYFVGVVIGVVLSFLALGTTSTEASNAGLRASPAVETESVWQSGPRQSRTLGDDPNYVTVLEEGFENGFPAANDWSVFFNEDFAPYRWDEEDFVKGKAGWCVGFSESSPEFPQLDPANDDYVDDLTSWMVWGPFDARDADSVFVEFEAWFDTQPGDSLYFGMATDGFNFLGWRVSRAGGVWESGRFEVREALGMNDYRNTESLYLAFVFESNTDGLTGRGVFLDDIRIEKRVPGPICQVSVSSLEFGDVEVGETADLPFTIANLGDRTLVGEVSFSCNDFELIGTSSISVAPDSQVDRTLRFRPQSEGLQSCSVSISGAPCTAIEATGTGVIFSLPAIEHTAVTTAAVGQALTVTTTLKGEGPPGEPVLTLWHREWSDDGLRWVSRNFTEQSGTYTAQIPGSEVTLGGLEYYLELSQGDLVGTLPVTAPANVFAVTTSSTTAVAPFQLPGGGEQTGYRMISVPGETSDRNVNSVLLDDLGAYADTVWRFFRFVDNDYEEYPAVSASRFAVGQAYWVLHRETGRSFDVSALSSRALEPFEIDLEPGWNDIANPFAEDLPSSAATVTVGSADGPYAYDGQWRAPDVTDRLQPWRGYSYFNSGTTTARLRIDPAAPDPGVAHRSEAESEAGSEARTRAGTGTGTGTGTENETEWRLRLSITSGNAVDDVVVGVGSAYTEGKDELDYVEPRAIGGSVSFFSDREGEIPWTQDLRGLPLSTLTWNLKTSVPVHRGCTLRWTTDGAVPDGWAMRVLSRDALRVIGTEESGQTVLEPRERDFVVVLARTDELEDETKSRLRPNAVGLQVLGPNPMQDRVRLEYRLPTEGEVEVTVFDVRGRRVRHLFDGRRTAGAYSVSWDGTDEQAGRVPAGIYFVRVSTEVESATRRLIVVR